MATVPPQRRKWAWLLLSVGLLFALGLVWLTSMSLYSIRPLGPLREPSGQIEQRSGADWAHIVIPENHCVLLNNMWNKGAAGSAFQQEIFREELANVPTIGWRWRSPWQLISRVVSQPQVVCGDKPWDEPQRLIADFPFQAGSKMLSADFKINLRASGTYNMAFTMWIVSALPASKSGITHEIMIWNANGGQAPAGSRRGAVNVNGVTYDVYVEENHKDASGANANVWTYVAFVAQEPVWQGPLEMSAFLDYLIAHGLLSRNHYVTSLELGNEVCQGAGIVEIQDFSIRFH